MPAYRLYYLVRIIRDPKFLSTRLRRKLELMEHMNVDVDGTMKFFGSLQPCYNFESSSDEDKIA